MRYLTLLLLVVLLPACGALKDMQAAAAEAKQFVAQGRKMLSTADRAIDASEKAIVKVETTYREAKIEADTNKDGKTSLDEWWKYIVAFLGLGTAGAAEARRRIGIRNAESDARKTATEVKTAEIAAELALLKAKASG